jgi:STE24 endopeptidase
MGVDPRTLISALYNITRLNHTVFRFNRVDATFQTHPSMARRILWIARQSQIPTEEIQELLKVKKQTEVAG